MRYISRHKTNIKGIYENVLRLRYTSTSSKRKTTRLNKNDQLLSSADKSSELKNPHARIIHQHAYARINDIHNYPSLCCHHHPPQSSKHPFINQPPLPYAAPPQQTTARGKIIMKGVKKKHTSNAQSTKQISFYAQAPLNLQGTPTP